MTSGQIGSDDHFPVRDNTGLGREQHIWLQPLYVRWVRPGTILTLLLPSLLPSTQRHFAPVTPSCQIDYAGVYMGSQLVVERPPCIDKCAPLEPHWLGEAAAYAASSALVLCQNVDND